MKIMRKLQTNRTENEQSTGQWPLYWQQQPMLRRHVWTLVMQPELAWQTVPTGLYTASITHTQHQSTGLTVMVNGKIQINFILHFSHKSIWLWYNRVWVHCLDLHKWIITQYMTCCMWREHWPAADNVFLKQFTHDVNQIWHVRLVDQTIYTLLQCFPWQPLILKTGFVGDLILYITNSHSLCVAASILSVSK